MPHPLNSRLTGDPAVRALLGRLLRHYVRPHAGRLAAAVACMALVAAATAAFAQLMKPIIDEIFVARRSEMLAPVALAVFAVFAVKGLATYGQAVLMSSVGHHIVARLQRELFRKLMATELAFFNATSPGQLVSRFVNDVGLLAEAVSKAVTGLGKDLLTLLALLGVLIYEDAALAAIAFFAFPAAVVPILRVGRRIRKVTDRKQDHLARMTTLLDEAFSGAKTVKAYRMEAHETARAEASIDRVRDLVVKSARIRNVLHPVMEILGGLAVVVVIAYGGSQVIAGEKAAGGFFAFITALLLAYEPLKRLGRLNASLQEGLAAARRVFALLDRAPGLVEAPAARPLALSDGAVRLEGVRFAYDPDGPPALDGVDLVAPAGATCALVGPSGAGKSTILNLIPRFFDVDAGRVCVDGQDVRGLTLDSLRDAIALVSQEAPLFDATIRENISYGCPDADDAAIRKAAADAQAEAFIAALPQGYDTPVGPAGTRLSGGQRQRIAIARAMLKDAPILLLDEATSALDSESEHAVQAALQRLMTGRTTIVIAHRLATVQDATVIHVLDGGRVVDSGTHAELLARGGAYARLHGLQAVGAPVAAGAR